VVRDDAKMKGDQLTDLWRKLHRKKGEFVSLPEEPRRKNDESKDFCTLQKMNHGQEGG